MASATARALLLLALAATAAAQQAAGVTDSGVVYTRPRTTVAPGTGATLVDAPVAVPPSTTRPAARDGAAATANNSCRCTIGTDQRTHHRITRTHAGCVRRAD